MLRLFETLLLWLSIIILIVIDIQIDWLVLFFIVFRAWKAFNAIAPVVTVNHFEVLC